MSLSHFQQNTTPLLAVLTESLQPARTDCSVSAPVVSAAFGRGARFNVVPLSTAQTSA
jgi:hypothetical protein